MKKSIICKAESSRRIKQFFKDISPLNNRVEMSAALLAVKKILAFMLCYMAGICIAEGAVIILHFALGKNIFIGEQFDGQLITLITLYGYIMVAAAALIYWKIIEKKPLRTMGINRHFGSYFAGAAAGVVLLSVSVAAVVLSGSMEYHGICKKVDVPMILLLTGGFVVQGAAEEILCRGVVLHSLKDKTPLWLAVAASTVTFIMPHWSSLFAGDIVYGIIGAANLILISVMFSLLTVRFGSIWAACGLHSFWNAVLYSVLGLNLSGNDEKVTAVFNMQTAGENIWNGGGYGIEGSVVTTAVLMLAIVIAWCTGRNKLKQSGRAKGTAVVSE